MAPRIKPVKATTAALALSFAGCQLMPVSAKDDSKATRLSKDQEQTLGDIPRIPII